MYSKYHLQSYSYKITRWPHCHIPSKLKGRLHFCTFKINVCLLLKEKKKGVAQGKLSALERTIIPTICYHRDRATIHSLCCSPQAAIVLQLRVVTVDLSNFISLLLISLPTAAPLPPCSAYFFYCNRQNEGREGMVSVWSLGHPQPPTETWNMRCVLGL